MLPKRMSSRVRIRSFLLAAAILALTLSFLLPEWIQAATVWVGKAVFAPVDSVLIETHLHEIQLDLVELKAFAGRGGAIEPLGDSLLVATPRGRLRIIDRDGQVENLQQRVPMNESASESPILWEGFRVADILLLEREPNEYTLFASHHYFKGDCVEFRISSTTLRSNGANTTLSDSWKTEFIANPCIDLEPFDYGRRGGITSGGRMLMDGPEHLLVVTGDHSFYEWYLEENPEEPPFVPGEDFHFGKLLRIELASGEVEIVAEGFRNPQGLARDADGNLWQTEHGPQAGDELNLVKPGLNYGWPHVTHGIQYGNKVWPYSEVQGRHDGFEKPVYSWIPRIGISNLIVSDGRHFPLWKDDLLIASLITHSLYRVRLHQGHVMYVEKIETGVRIRDIAQMPDGRIALLTDSANVLFLHRAPLYCQSENDVDSIFSYDAEDVCVDLSDIFSAADDPLIRSLDDTEYDKPIVRSLFSIYLHGNRITYVKSPCISSDIDRRFFLHTTPTDASFLAEGNEQLGFDVLDFNVGEDNIGATIHEEGCIVTLALPEYDLKHIFTGQVIRVEEPSGEISWKGPVWEASFTFREAPDLATETADSPYPQGNAGIPSPGAELFAARCGSCHKLTAEHHIGPHLNGVIGRRAGVIAGFNATAALTGLEIVWTRENLAEFIASPEQVAPGTTMAGVGVAEEEAQLIVEFLAASQ